MSETQALEGAWLDLDAEMDRLEEVYKVPADTVYYDLANAARALALAALEGATSYDTKHNHREIRAGCCEYHDLRRRIEELGK